MRKKEEIKRIERRARAMLLTKEIPPHKQELVRTLINNKQLDQKEKWRAVIELIQNCGDKEPVLYRERARVELVKKARPPVKKPVNKPATELYAPTETSYYVDELYRKYRRLKFFRIRYLAHRNNRIGIGIRKRLIPTKKFLKVIEHVALAQNLIQSRINAIMTEILMDDSAEEPILFNYLSLVRTWMAEVPLLGEPYETIKWMERHDFDGPFRTHVAAFFSFLKLDVETREKIMIEVESRLRSLDDLKKEEISEHEPDARRREMEKRNYEREKNVFEYLSTIRSFLPIDVQQECALSKQLEKKYAVNNYAALLLMAEEALVFQRPIKLEEMVAFYGITAPAVSTKDWDCSQDVLKRAGKDAESIKKKKLDALRKKLEPYETLAMLLKIEHGGRNVLLKAFADQMKYIERRQHDPKNVYGENYIYFLYGLVHYFKNMYLPFLDGSPLLFRDMGRDEYAGSMFSPNYFSSHCENFRHIVDDINVFRSNNAGYRVTKNDVKRSLKGEIVLPEQAALIIRFVGDFFYGVGNELQYWYDSHRLWASSRSKPAYPDLSHTSIMDRDLDSQNAQGRPIPYYNCVIKEVKNRTPLMNEVLGKRVLEDSLRDGVYVQLNAFAYQVAYECHNGSLLRDLDDMKSVRKMIVQEMQ